MFPARRHRHRSPAGWPIRHHVVEDGRPAIGIGVSMVENGNIIALGKALDAAIDGSGRLPVESP